MSIPEVAALRRGNEAGAVPKRCPGSGGFGGSVGSSGGLAPTFGVRDKAQVANRESILAVGVPRRKRVFGKFLCLGSSCTRSAAV